MSSLSSEPEAALEAECERVSLAVLRLSETAFAERTRCTEWNVKELLAHMYRDIDRIAAYLSVSAPANVTHDAASYFVAPGPSGSAHARMVAAWAWEIADRYASGHDLARAWDDRWRRVIDLVRSVDPERSVETFGPSLTLREYVKTRVVEITVHGLDLADAIAEPAWATGDGLAVTKDVLEVMLGSPVPVELRLGADRLRRGGHRPAQGDGQRASPAPGPRGSVASVLLTKDARSTRSSPTVGVPSAPSAAGADRR